MEDLVPFLIFIVIAVVNVLKFAAEKAGKKKQIPGPSGEIAPKRPPSTIESFFEEIAEKLEPKPVDLPDWPEDRERPDYVHQTDGFRHDDAEVFREEVASIPEPFYLPVESPEAAEVLATESIAAFQSHVPAAASVFSGSAMRLPSMPVLRSSSAGRIDFDLKEKGRLKQAIIASIVFGQPRVYDRSFDTTLAK